MKYFALLTKLGENLLAQATALGTKLELTHMAVGDGGGSLPTPDTNQTKLIAEKRRAAINTLFIDDKNKNQIIAEQIIPEQDGGWWIREIGLFDKASNLIAVANCPETYKPQLAEGSGRTQSIRMVLIVSHTESVTLKIDPSVVLATREYVNTEIAVLDKKIQLDLDGKLDKAGGKVTGNLSVLGSFEVHSGTILAVVPDKCGIQLDSKGDKPTLKSRITPSVGWLTHELPSASGVILQRGDSGLGVKSSEKLTPKAKDWNENGFWAGERAEDNTTVFGISVNYQDALYGFNLYGRGNNVYYSGREKGIQGQEHLFWTSANLDPSRYLLTSSAVLELNKKFDKTGGQITGSLNSLGTIESHFGRVSAVVPSGNGVQLDASGNLPALRSRKAGGAYVEHVMPDVAGKLAQIGDGGIGVSSEQACGSSSINTFVSYTSAVAATEHGWPTNGAGFQCVYAETRRAQFHISQQGEVLSRFSILSGSDKETPWNKHYTTANTKLDKNGYLKSASSSIELVGVPVGGSILWNANAPIPNDFWANEGRSFSKTEYPEAAKIFPDLKLPDDRGYAIRIADNGRGIDAGRTVGTYQEDAMRNLTGTIGGHWRTSLSAFSGVFTGGRVAQANTKGETDETYLGAGFDASKQVPTANEFRMKNVAKILITRMR
ncbi:phage tail protein [Providencia rettgeri]